jgi:hypothetical protein
MSRSIWYRQTAVALTLVFLAVIAPLGTTSAAAASATSPETALAERYVPVVELVNSPGPCVQGEPYEPLNVDVVLGNPEVALRGPWSGNNIVKVAPTATDLSVGLSSYNLDYPGNALSHGCTYADWAAQIQHTAPPTVYAHIATESAYPGKLALQYWFFYLYNDFNDKHEGDWEMIQLDFHASTAEQALSVKPYETGYSQHEGAERAAWGTDSKLQIVDGTHPVVYPALGSHANYYSSHLYLGHSASQGVGCDDTLGPSRALHPQLVVLPQNSSQYLKDDPWLGYLGRWGEKQAAFNNGPTGPATKDRWSAPFTWVASSWRDKSFAVPEGSAVGHTATDFFCTAVARGSSVFNAIAAHGSIVVLVLIAIVVLLIWLASRTRWTPAVVLRVRRRRPWGTLVTSGFRMYASRPRLFAGIGLVFIPLGLIVAGLQYVFIDHGFLSPLVQSADETNAFVQALVNGLGAVVTLIGLTIVQAAAAYAVMEIDAGRTPTVLASLRRVLASSRQLVVSLVVATVVVGLLSLTVAGAVVGVYLVVRWSLLAQAAILDGESSLLSPLRQSMHRTRRHFWRTASVTLFVTLLSLFIGPLIGTGLLFATNASFNWINLIAAVVDSVVAPFVAITTTYLYADLSVRHSLETSEARGAKVLPAEG